MAEKKANKSLDTGLKVGEILRNSREKTRKSTARVAKEICIRRIYLEAIEECRYDDTPGVAYTVGFIRSYAAYLGLNPDEVVAAFNNENNRAYFNDIIKDKEKEFEEKDRKFKEAMAATEKAEFVQKNAEMIKQTREFYNFVRENKLIIILSALSVLMLIIGIVLFFAMETDVEEAEIPETVATNVVEIQTEDPAYVQIMKAKEEILKNKVEETEAKPDFSTDSKIYGDMNSTDIKFQAVSEVWVQVTDVVSDKVVFSKILLPGDEYRAKSNKNHVLVVGNAGGLRVIVDDQDLGLLGREGSRKSGLVLDKADLKELLN